MSRRRTSLTVLNMLIMKSQNMGSKPSGKIDVEANKVEIPRGATDLDL